MEQSQKQVIQTLLGNIRERSDEPSFKKLFQLFYPRLLHFAVQFVHSQEAAEELVNDVFTKLWIRRKSLTGIVNPETYLFISVKNACLNYIKQFSRYRVTELNAENSAQLINSHDPAREAESRELHFKLTEAIEKLPRTSRLVFKLIKEDGLKYKEVAEIVSISPRTVETHLTRALKKLDQVVCSYQQHQPYRPKRSSPFGRLNFFQIFF